MLQSMLEAYLDRNRYDLVVQHLPLDIAGFLDIDAISTCTTHPTDPTDLDALSSLLAEKAEQYGHVSGRTTGLNTLRGVLLYQFGHADTLLEGCTVKGRHPHYRFGQGGRQLGMLVAGRGFISLTLEGGKRLADKGGYDVVIDDFIPKGSVFSVGVQQADPDIRAGDDVVIMHDGEVRAVGVACMNGAEMVESMRGEAVTTRHHC
jgi:archaeosine synthase